MFAGGSSVVVTLPLCVVVASDVVDVEGEVIVTASVLLTKLLSVVPVVDVMVSLKLSVRTVEVVLMVCWFSLVARISAALSPLLPEKC